MINDTAAAIIAAQAKELEHLRAQRDQLQRDCTRFEAVVDGVIVDRHTKMKAAATAEWHARHSGLIPTGHIDRSALT